MHRLSNVDLKLLRSADALLIERDVARAARRLDMSPENMQQDLMRLRELLGDPVLVRSADEWVLTRRAGTMASSLPQLLFQLSRLLDTGTFVPAQAQGRVRVSITDSTAASIVPRLAARIIAEAPGICFEMLSWHGQSLVELERGVVDMAIDVAGPVPEALYHREIGRDQLLCGLRPGHPLLSTPLDLDAYLSAFHLAVSPGDGGAGLVDMALAAQGLRRQVVARVPAMELAVDLALRSDLLITAPGRFFGVDGSKLVLCVPPLNLPPLSLNMVWGERGQHDPLCAWIRAVVLEIAESI